MSAVKLIDIEKVTLKENKLRETERFENKEDVE